MTEKYTLKYTNHFSHTLNPFKREEEEITIVGDCKITNYNPKKESGEKKGYITINFNNDEQTIKEGQGEKLSSNQSEADFSNKKFSIFSKIAQLDGNGSELSVNDIKKMKKSLIKEWGLKDLRFDYKNGVATLIWGENDILRIDFKMSHETDNSLDKSPKKINGIDIQKIHTVAIGESLAKLAQKYGVNTPEIINVNLQIPRDSIVKNKDGSLLVKLKAGQKINIPVPKKMKVIQFSEINQNEKAFLNNLAARESSSGKNTKSAGNYLGYYQVGEEALRSIKVYKKDGTNDPKKGNDWKLKNWPKNDFNIKNKTDFIKNKSKQDAAIIAIMRFNWSVLEEKKDTLNVNDYIGKTINGIKITKAGILAGAHLCGTGNLIKFLKSNGKIDEKDGNNVSISTYIKDFSCYGNNVPSLTSPLYVYD